MATKLKGEPGPQSCLESEGVEDLKFLLKCLQKLLRDKPVLSKLGFTRSNPHWKLCLGATTWRGRINCRCRWESLLPEWHWIPHTYCAFTTCYVPQTPGQWAKGCQSLLKAPSMCDFCTGITDHLLPYLLPDPSSLLHQPSRWQMLPSAKHWHKPSHCQPLSGHRSSGTARALSSCSVAHILSFQNKTLQEDFLKPPNDYQCQNLPCLPVSFSLCSLTETSHMRPLQC